MYLELQHYRPVRLGHSRHRQIRSSSDRRQFQERDVFRAALRRSHPRPVPGPVSRPTGRRTRPRGDALLETAVPLSIAGNDDQMDAIAERKARLSRFLVRA